MSKQIPRGTDVDGDMTPDEQRIAIAEACGWSVIDMSDPLKVVVEGQAIWPHSVKDCPDYLNDLNAILGAVRSMTPVQKDEVVQRIGWSAVRQVLDHQYIADATARQWSAVYLKTLGLWEESK